MSSIRKYSTASLLCLLMVLRLTYGAAIANRTTNSDLQSRDWDLFPTDNGVMGSACAEMMDARLPNFEYEVGVSTKTELPEAGVWDLCYIRGKYLWTFDDTAVTKCLIDLHHRQDNVCISVKGSRCEKVKGTSHIQNAHVRLGWIEGQQFTSSASIAMQGAADNMIGRKVCSSDVTLPGIPNVGTSKFTRGNVYLGRREHPSAVYDDYKMYVTFEGQKNKEC